MATDIFLKLGDVKGESKDAAHKEEIELHSWSFGVSNTGTMGDGGGGGTGKANLSEISITHEMDKASPTLMLACSTGKHFDEAVLTSRKSGGTQQEYLTIKLSTVYITGVHVNQGGSERPTETISLMFGKIELEYKPQKPDGTLDAGVQYKYNVYETATF
jgi:type VI secretion system secreted protein Hcp